MKFDVILGGFVFENFEIPRSIPFGGEQLEAKNIMIGGDRIIEAMGWDPGNIEWHGRFIGPFAVARALELKAMAESGMTMPLVWAGFYYVVRICHFHPRMEKLFEIPYEIGLTVIEDPAQAGAVFQTTTDDLVNADMAAATAKFGLTGPVGGTTGTSVSGGFGFSGGIP
jgi:hypothetical protein